MRFLFGDSRWRFALERWCEVPIAGRFVRFLVDLAAVAGVDARGEGENESRVAGQLAAVNEHAAAANRATYGMAAAFSHEQREAIDRLDRVSSSRRSRPRAWRHGRQALTSALPPVRTRPRAWQHGRRALTSAFGAGAVEAARMASWKTVR